MDGNKSSDDEIELLNPSTADDNGVQGEIYDQESSVNPAIFLCRGPSDDNTSINPASVHALQTACTSLQHKLNDKTKKYNELYQRNKLMQKALLDMNKPESMRQGMEDLCPDPSVVHAAGAGACSVEDEGVVAEQRARQGYISHLEREVLRNTSAIARGNEEIQRLKMTVDERDREKKTFLQKIDQLQTELERNQMSSRSFDDNMRAYEENIRKYEDNIRVNQQTIDDLENQRQYLYHENTSLKEAIEMLNKNGTKEVENRDLKSKLVVAEKEMTKLTIQYRDLDQRTQEKEEELCRLRAQCNQYEIEAEITRKYRTSESGCGDEVDGDAEELMRALDMIKNQRSEVTSLMTQVQQQKAVIKELLLANDRESRSLSKAPSSYKEERGEALGASIHQFGDEAGSVNVRTYVSSSSNHCNTPLTAITTNIGVAPVQEQVSSSQKRREISPITRRQSDRGPSRQPITTSPRLKEHFVPTGSTHIPEMLANEDQRAARRAPGSNVFDATSPRLSPHSHAQSPQPQPLYMNISQAGSPSSQRRNAGPSLGDTIKVETQNSPRSRTEVHRNIEPIPSPSSPRTRLEQNRPGESQSPSSPRSRTEQHRNIMEPTLLQPIHLLPSANNTGARPKQNYSQDDFATQNRFMDNSGSSSAQNRLPDRMTQSAILLRDEGNTDNNLMSRSMFSPNLTLEVNERNSPERNDFSRPAPPPVWPRPENHPEPVYGNNIRRPDNNGPDYENIVNIKPHSAGNRRPVEEHEDNVFVNDMTVNQAPVVRTMGDTSSSSGVSTAPTTTIAQNPPHIEPSEVSALKICPVCNLEYSRLTMDQFQTHVFECFDNCEEPTTLQPVVASATDDDRQCPMCGETFPLAIAQEMYEQHVLAHFGEEPMMERFELINS